MPAMLEVGDIGPELDLLAALSDAPAPAVTRILWTGRDLEARAWLRGLAESAGLRWREDAIGNLFVRLEGREDLPAVATGSHTDAIPLSGRYDGTVGVLGGLEALRSIQRSGQTPRRPIELIMFTAEEPTRFGVGCLGSRAMSGAMSPDELLKLRDEAGIGLDDVRQSAGYTGSLDSVRLAPGHYHAFLELHIEQMPSLEAEGLPIGVVSAIAAPASYTVRLSGEGGHAGARLMPGRKDALLAGAEIALAVEHAVLATGSPDTVGTTGVLRILPGAINSIPSSAELGIDIRDTDGARRDGAVEQMLNVARAICERRGVELNVEVLNSDPPASCAPQVMAAAEQAARELNLPFKTLVSRAYHDSLFMARLCPTGMVFIPCFKGYSHRPDEYASPSDIRAGVAVLAQALWTLAEG